LEGLGLNPKLSVAYPPFGFAFAAEAGIAATVAFVGNEIKDEVLS